MGTWHYTKTPQFRVGGWRGGGLNELYWNSILFSGGEEGMMIKTRTPGLGNGGEDFEHVGQKPINKYAC